ncbi:MAG: restriction endonuclease [Bacteroidia bacterium]|nr:restriction endonuclease [Bacteroidia bacterium]MCF8427166.1 restriction endonuclease [Bacteroidia bacterium]MCF8445811.1 restriction endonuclease [Bacteroidia bacterium]
MDKLEEAKLLLHNFGLPKQQCNDISAYTLLALCQLRGQDEWKDAKSISLGVSKGIMSFIADNYGRFYKPNTRETVRRQVLHQFVQASLALYNPDIPDLPPNSPRVHYAISDLALKVIRSNGSEDFESQMNEFHSKSGTWKEKHTKIRKLNSVPITLNDGKEILLSPGKHNLVQKAIVEQFAPRFAPNSILLYIGDTEKKEVIFEQKIFKEIGINIDSHSKLPDVILFDRSKNWLFLIEAVTSHGPVSEKRMFEIEEVLKDCTAGRVYVTAFPDMKEFRKYFHEIAWESEVWVTEIPDHMIHFNGDRFMGPRQN